MAIWNLGSINIDHVYRLAHLPQPGETIAAQGYALGLGGKGANQSIAAARAGASTLHLGAMSDGDDWVCRRLVEYGVKTHLIQRQSGQTTGHAIILLESSGENSIVIHPGANRQIDAAALMAAMDEITAADTLLLQNETSLQVQAAQAARAKGAKVIYSAAPFDLQALREVLPYVSVLAMNAGEAEQLFAAMPGEIPVEGLLITRGAEGAEYRDLTTGETTHQPAFAVRPVDTTGAGDTFAGYFAAAQDRGASIAAALELAAAAAALKVTRAGAGDAIPTYDEVQEFLQSFPG
ncbi:ribokinase [Paracoccus seriniphilus]|uniref:ribokinase n=1 Tax=Paracoccus seriniphilus TaxID=184748 RepID=UPI00356698CC